MCKFMHDLVGEPEAFRGCSQAYPQPTSFGVCQSFNGQSPSEIYNSLPNIQLWESVFGSNTSGKITNATTLSIMTLRIMTLRIMIISIMTLRIMTLSITTLRIMTLSITTLSIMTLSGDPLSIMILSIIIDRMQHAAY
jgi:hypothetical protein